MMTFLLSSFIKAFSGKQPPTRRVTFKPLEKAHLGTLEVQPIFPSPSMLAIRWTDRCPHVSHVFKHKFESAVNFGPSAVKYDKGGERGHAGFPYKHAERFLCWALSSTFKKMFLSYSQRYVSQ